MLRTYEPSLPPSVKTYATPQRAKAEAIKVAECCRGMVNVTLTPIEQADKTQRYTAIFFCFSDASDIQHVARAG